MRFPAQPLQVFMYCRLICYCYFFYCYHNLVDIQLFQERLSKKVHATVPKGIGLILSSLFFKEISKNGRSGHGRMFASAKGKYQK